MIDLEVRNELGVVLGRAERGIRWDATVAKLERSTFPMLGHVGPVMDTMFNSCQVETVLAELDRVPPQTDSSWIGQVRSLCLVVQEAPHRYLWFLGD